MKTTALGNRTHIGIFGKRNVGKSSLLNAITEQNISLVSPIGGTTTDPVKKAMELLPFGPVLFIDTAGLDDEGALGELRATRSKEMFSQIDFALLVHGADDVDLEFEKNIIRKLKTFSVPYLKLINKKDLLSETQKHYYEEELSDYLLVSTKERESILSLKSVLIEKLYRQEEETLVGDLLPYGSHIVLVVPIDSEAPKGRLILPQVQLLRDALDHGIHCHVARDTELCQLLSFLPKVDLVITDSQAFQKVSQMVPKEIPLTSFSILFARQKGDVHIFHEGILQMEQLPSNAKVLIAETCTHNTSHEDIGRVKIPSLLKRNLGEDITFSFFQGKEYPEDLSTYDLVIHCGGCMITKKQMHNRILQVTEQGVPITNYGVVLAWGAKILERSLAPFDQSLFSLAK